MIVRCWKGITTKENADKYFDFLNQILVPAFHTLKGFIRVEIMKRSDKDGFEFQVLTYWNTIDDIVQFAPDDISIATVPDEARSLLLSFDKTVTHYELMPLD